MRRSMIATCLLALSAATLARADSLNYTVTGNGTTYTFTLPVNPTLSGVDPYRYFFTNADVSVNGAAAVTTSIEFALSSATSYCRLAFLASNVQVCDGNSDTFFTGSTVNPTLVPVSFTFADQGSTFTVNAVPASAVAATPEPSSVALLGTGVLGLLGAARRRFTR